MYLDKRRSKNIGSVTVTDTDFADHIALISEKIHQGHELLTRVEMEAPTVDLHSNAKKTEVMSFNQDDNVTIKSLSNDTINNVTDFK